MPIVENGVDRVYNKRYCAQKSSLCRLPFIMFISPLLGKCFLYFFKKAFIAFFGLWCKIFTII